MFVDNTTDSRTFFINVWRKMSGKQILEPLEALIANIIEQHPEYHPLLADPDLALADDYLARHFEVNPFLHLGLHIALAEQLQADRPAGVVSIFQKHQGQDQHELQHQMMACLAKALTKAQQNGSMPDDNSYLACLGRIGQTASQTGSRTSSVSAGRA